MENNYKVINMEPKTAIIENLQRYLGEGINLREKLQEIISKIDETKDSTIKKNLQYWKEKYIQKINNSQYFNADKYINVHNNINELFVEEYIFTHGLKLGDMEIKKFDRQKIIGMGVIDLLGYHGENKIIIELKGYGARASVIGQVLSYWQYYKETENKSYQVIVIAPKFSEQYRYALRAIKDVPIKNITYKLVKDELVFKQVFDK